ncbi:MAG: LytR C-terminal domain-containing protein [Acidimicrobiales bacterium]
MSDAPTAEPDLEHPTTMQAHHESDERSGGPGVEVTRGVIVILLAVAVGAFVVTQGLKSDGESVAAASDVATVSGAEDGSLGSDSGDGITGDENGDDGAADEIGGATAESGDGDAMVSDDPTAGDDGDTAVGGDDPDDATVSTESAADAESDPAGPGTQTAADITVLVLNGAGAKGTAGRGSAILQDAGYEVLAPRNATVLGPSKIFYTEGFEEAANGIAGSYSVDPAAVVAPLDPANPPIDDTRGADVIVVVGEDGLIQV